MISFRRIYDIANDQWRIYARDGDQECWMYSSFEYKQAFDLKSNEILTEEAWKKDTKRLTDILKGIINEEDHLPLRWTRLR